jgi:hypothetical protein
MDATKGFSLKTLSIVNRNKFDALRKVAQFHAINNKIEKCIKQVNPPPYYPRGIDEIKRYYVDSSIGTKKIELAIENIFR